MRRPETAGETESLQDRVASVVADALQVRALAPEADLLETGTLDSVGLVTLLVQLERRFGVKIDLEELDIDQFRSVAGIAEFIARTQQEKK